MADRKTERLMNLIFALLVAPSYVSRSQIREAIADYRESSDEAFERKFERDKDELRDLGIALERGFNDRYFADEPGYRIRRDDVELPDLDLTREEAAVVGLAAQVWEHSAMAADSATALVKLRSAGLTLDTDVLRMAEPRLDRADPGFAVVADAAARRVPIEFEYARPGQPSMVRHLQPWRLMSYRGRWYVGGYDTDREAPRLFRLSRVVGSVVQRGGSGAFDVPEGPEVAAVMRGLLPARPDRTAVLQIKPGRAALLRAQGRLREHLDDGSDLVEVSYSSARDFASELTSLGSGVVVLEPAELRDQVIERLKAAIRQGDS